MDRSRIPIRTSLAFAAVLSASCVSYQAAPLDLNKALATSNALELPSAALATSGLTPLELAFFAVRFHPSLAQARAELAVAEARIAQAGQWSDLDIEWGAMDALASEWSEGHTKRVDYIGSLDVMLALPKPGEREAETAIAKWRADELQNLLIQAEWRLAVGVQQACVEVASARKLLAQASGLLEVTTRSRDYFARALEAGAATRTESSLASGDYQAALVDVASAQASLRSANRHLNALLGVRPGYAVELADVEQWGLGEASVDAAALQAKALADRPDMWAARSHYEVSEASLRLAIADQYPRIAIGTGLSLSLGLFNAFNRPAVETALRDRDAARASFESLAFQVRNEVFEAHEAHRDAVALLELIEGALIANAEASLAAVEVAYGTGEVSVLETLNVQRALVAARKQLNEARAAELRARVALLAVSGQLAGASTNTTEQLR